jgi:hypothetical protein
MPDRVDITPPRFGSFRMRWFNRFSEARHHQLHIRFPAQLQ